MLFIVFKKCSNCLTYKELSFGDIFVKIHLPIRFVFQLYD